MGMMIRRNRMRKAAQVQPKKVEPVKAVKPVVDLEFTKDDIEKMNFLKMKSLAKKNGIETEDREAKDIRAELIEKLGL